MENTVVLQGRLVHDPELKHAVGSGYPVCSFKIACDRNFKDSNGVRKTDFFNIVTWNQNAEFVAKQFKKRQKDSGSRKYDAGRVERR